MAKVQILDRNTALTAKGDIPSLEFQVLWSGLRRDVDSATAAAGSRIVAFRQVTADTTALPSDYLILVDAAAGAVTVNLPSAVSSRGAALVVKKIDASGNAVTIDANGAETIDGAATQSLAAQYDSLTIICDASQWWIV
jgi:hypothetical protein